MREEELHAYTQKRCTYLALAINAHVQTAWATARSVLNLRSQLHHYGLLLCERFTRRPPAASQCTGLAVIVMCSPKQQLTLVRYIVVGPALLLPEIA